MFSGLFRSQRAENRPENAQDSSEYGETGREDEENPRARDEWEADETDSVQSTNKSEGGATSAEAEDLCFCQRRWNSENLKLPLRHLPETDIQKFLKKEVPLHKAILNGDLVRVKEILEIDPTALACSSIIVGYETALHVAVEARQAAIVKELVECMRSEQLELQDRIGNTAFCTGAATGCVKIAKILMAKNSKLPLLRGSCNKTPLNIAATYGNPEMIRFLYQHFEDHNHIPHLNEEELEEIFFACIHTGLSDLAIKMLGCHLNTFQNLAWARKDGETALGILARMPSAFASKSTLRTPKTLKSLCCGRSDTISTQNLELTELLFWKILLDDRKSFEDRIDQTSEVLFEAARLGNYNFLTQLLCSCPHLISKRDVNKGSIFHVAVLHRQTSIFKQIYNIGLLKDKIVTYEVRIADENKESQALDENHICYNMLHLAAKLPSLDRLNMVSGAALQMQRELLWFKEVELLMPPSEREKRDPKYKLTPRELFTKEHSDLRKAGEEWMKNTAQSCMIVATLVTAVVFTVTSGLPGGNDSATGSPMNIDKAMFHVFAVADAVALSSSIIATLMFLSIFTSRYAEEDFRVSLPLRLAAGITALLLSTLGIMVAFTSIFFLTYDKHEVRWVPVLASAISVFPVIIVFVLQYKVVLDVIRSTFGSRYLFRPYNNSKFWEPQC